MSIAGPESPGSARVAALEAQVRALTTELSERLHHCPDSGAWRRVENWRRLRRGLNRFAVYAILGDPGRTVRYEGSERWEYPDLLGGWVTFDADGALFGWRPPPRHVGHMARQRPGAAP